MKKQKEAKQSPKLEELENKLKKALSDYTNLERDIDKRVEQRIVMQKMAIAREMMGLLDSMTLAVGTRKNLKLEGDVVAWADGISAILSQMEKVLIGLGVTKMDVKSGDSFDSSVHEALGMVSEGEKGKIHEVVFNGYVLGEYVVRPARVIVCQGKK